MLLEEALEMLIEKNLFNFLCRFLAEFRPLDSPQIEFVFRLQKAGVFGNGLC